MSHLDFQYISIVAWSYICVYRPVFPVWRCKTLKSAWCKLNCLESANTVSFSHFQNNEAIGECQGVGYASAMF